METILVIEDDHDIAELIEHHLKQNRFDVLVSENGTQGLKIARKQTPHLIILDLMLPDMGGLEVCRELKTTETTKYIPVIMLTAKGEEVDRIVGFEVGADDYMTKPFSPRELTLRVKAIVKRSKEGSWTQE